MANSSLEKRKRAHLDTFTRRRIRRAGGVVEGGVSGPARPAIFTRVKGFKNYRLVGLHIREIIPTMLRIKCAVIYFADAVRVNARAGDQLLRANAPRVSNGQWLSLDWISNRTPDLHDGKSALDQLVGLVGKQVAHALRAGPLGIIIVRVTYGAADLFRFTHRAVCRAQRVVKDQNTFCARHFLYQPFDLRVVNRAHFNFVIEISNFGIMVNEDKAFSL